MNNFDGFLKGNGYFSTDNTILDRNMNIKSDQKLRPSNEGLRIRYIHVLFFHVSHPICAKLRAVALYFIKEDKNGDL